MGIFVDALREETEFLDNTGFDGGAVANPDDKYEVELNDVAKAVEDINQNYADQSSQEELDGQDLEEDPVSECMIAIYESEHNWNLIMNALAMREVNEAAIGREMVLESVDIKGFFAKVKEFFVTMWKKITAVVKNWIDNATAALRTNKSFIAKYESKLGEGKTAYEADPNKKAFKGYNFNILEKTAFMGLFDTVKDETNNEVKAANAIITSLNAGNKDYSGIVEKSDNDAVRGKFCGKSHPPVSADGYRKALKEAYFGSEEKKTLSGDAVSVNTITAVLKGDMKMKDIKKAYSDMKSSINTSLKTLSNLEKAVQNSYKKGEASAETSAAITAISKNYGIVKEQKSIAHMALTTYMKAAHAQASQARRIANAYIFALNKKTRKGKIDAANGKPTHESAGFFSSLDLI